MFSVSVLCFSVFHAGKGKRPNNCLNTFNNVVNDNSQAANKQNVQSKQRIAEFT